MTWLIELLASLWKSTRVLSDIEGGPIKALSHKNGHSEALAWNVLTKTLRNLQNHYETTTKLPKKYKTYKTTTAKPAKPQHKPSNTPTSLEQPCSLLGGRAWVQLMTNWWFRRFIFPPFETKKPKGRFEQCFENSSFTSSFTGASRSPGCHSIQQNSHLQHLQTTLQGLLLEPEGSERQVAS